jgi:hypothetical protein
LSQSEPERLGSFSFLYKGLPKFISGFLFLDLLFSSILLDGLASHLGHTLLFFPQFCQVSLLEDFQIIYKLTDSLSLFLKLFNLKLIHQDLVIFKLHKHQIFY